MNDTFLDKLFRKLRNRHVLAYVKREGVVCDVGCGIHFPLLKQVSSFVRQGIGIDKNVVFQEWKNIKIKNAEVDNVLPLEDESVDTVTFIAVLEHLDNPTAILKEALRILKPGGNIVITVPTWRAKPVLEFLAFRLGIIDAELLREHKKYFWKLELHEILAVAGFQKAKLFSFEFGFNLFAVAYK